MPSLSQRMKREPFSLPTAEDVAQAILVVEAVEAFQAAEQALADWNSAHPTGLNVAPVELYYAITEAKARLLEVNLT